MTDMFLCYPYQRESACRIIEKEPECNMNVDTYPCDNIVSYSPVKSLFVRTVSYKHVATTYIHHVSKFCRRMRFPEHMFSRWLMTRFDATYDGQQHVFMIPGNISMSEILMIIMTEYGRRPYSVM